MPPSLPSRASTPFPHPTPSSPLQPSPAPKARLTPSLADPNPDALERHKQDSIAKQKAGKGHWKAELASVSEESVKADRLMAAGGSSSSADAIKKLQEQTKGDAEEAHKHGTSMKDM